MIQSIYSNDDLNSKIDNDGLAFKMPKNIRQIGQVDLAKKIYAEDYVMTYIKQLAEKAIIGEKKAVLLGQYIKAEGARHIFINGAVEIIESQPQDDTVFSNEVWTEIYDCIKKYFTNVEIVGWYITKNDGPFDVDEHITKMHLDNFGGQDKTLLVYDSIEKEEAFYFYDKGTLKRQTGYYIYYDRNEEMQNYMIENSDHKRSDEGYVDIATQKIRKVIEAKSEANQHKSLAPLVYTASSLLAVVVLVIGVTMVNNYDKEEGGEKSVAVLSESVVNKSDANKVGDTSQGVTKVETIGTTINNKDQGEGVETSNNGADTDDVQAMIEENEAARKKNIEKEESELNEKQTKEEEQDEKKEKQKTVEKKQDSKKTSKEEEDSSKSKKASSKEKQSAETNKVEEMMEYTVKKGDTLVSISTSVYGTIKGVDLLQKANNIENQDLIYEGQVIKIPDKE